MFNREVFAEFNNWVHYVISWPYWLPRKLRHPLYDNLLFPRAIKKLKPDFVFSPYHDVLLPSKQKIRSVMTVHDTCIDELRKLYPVGFRAYYVAMLRRNLKRSIHLLTDSESSRCRIIEIYGVAPNKLSVIYNAIEPEFENANINNLMIASIKECCAGARLILYPGGSDFRKNIGRLLDAFALLSEDSEDYRLLVTGERNRVWDRELRRHGNILRDRIQFLGHLNIPELKAHYAAADAVIYPSLCEGFGRVCVEAMTVGASIACSDLPVLREIAGEYAFYFDPINPRAIEATLRHALNAGRMLPRRDSRFSLESVTSRFTALMDYLVAGAGPNARKA
jgi:glycosyltransferase involved in cell wall biosynthesis